MNRSTEFLTKYLGDVGLVFYISVLLITAFVTIAALQPELVESITQKVLDATARNVGWMYLMATTGFVLFVLFLALSKFGTLRLGQDNEPPEFSFTSWLAMIFSGGMGVGLVFWGVAEPIMHFNEPPLGLAEPRSAEAAQLGMRYAFFHWGLHQWANFTLVGLAIAYVRFRHSSHGLISETFRPLWQIEWTNGGERPSTFWLCYPLFLASPQPLALVPCKLTAGWPDWESRNIR